MQIHTVGETPSRFAAGPLGKVAEFRFDHAEIAPRQRTEAAETVALIKTLLGTLAAGDTGDCSGIFNTNRLAKKGIERQLHLANRQAIRHRALCRCDRFRTWPCICSISLSMLTLSVH